MNNIYDPSEIDNSINGFDLLKCNMAEPMDIILVIPNISYGILSTLYSRMKNTSSYSSPENGLSYKIVDIDEKNADSPVKYGGTTEEIFDIGNGFTKEIISTKFRLNDVCASSLTLENSITIPIPLKATIINPDNDENNVIESTRKSKDLQLSLARLAFSIAASNTSVDTTDYIQLAAALEVIRYMSASSMMDETSKWTDDGMVSDNDQEARIEIFDYLNSPENETEDTREIWADRIASENIIPEYRNIFAKSFVGIVIEISGKKKLYYSEDLTRAIFESFKITGRKHPPQIVYNDKLYALNIEENTEDNFSIATTINREEAENILHINEDISRILYSEDNIANNVFNEDDVSNISEIIYYNLDSETEETIDVVLYTPRPPIFTNSEFQTMYDQEKDDLIYFFPFTTDYIWPVIEGEIGISESGNCRICGGIGKYQWTRCLYCTNYGYETYFEYYNVNQPVKPGKIPCPSCYDYSTGLSLGYLIDQQNISFPCSTCNENDTGGENKGYIVCPHCVDGIWPDLPCIECGGTGQTSWIPCDECQPLLVSNMKNVLASNPIIPISIPNPPYDIDSKSYAIYIGISGSDKYYFVPDNYYDQILYDLSQPILENNVLVFDIIMKENIVNIIPIPSGHSNIDILIYAVNNESCDTCKTSYSDNSTGFYYGQGVPSTAILEPKFHLYKKSMYYDPDKVTDENLRNSIPYREGFGTLIYNTHRYLEIIKLIQSNIYRYSSQYIDISDGNSTISKYMARNCRITNKTLRFKNWELANLSPDIPSLDGLLIAPNLAAQYTTEKLMNSYHTFTSNICKEKPSDLDSMTKLDELLTELNGDSLPSKIEDSNWQIVFKTLTTKLIPPDSDETINTKLPKSGIINPYAHTRSPLENMIDPIHEASRIVIDNEGKISISDMFGSLIRSDDNLPIDYLSSITSDISQIIYHLEQTMRSSLLRIAPIEGSNPIKFNIIQPEPLFSLEMDTSVDNTSGDLLSILSIDINVKLMKIKEQIEQISNSVNPDLLYSIFSTLLSIYSSISNIERNLFIYDNATNMVFFAIYTDYESSNSWEKVLIPSTHINKGLYYYNIRKSYMLMKASVNIVRSLFQDLISIFSSIQYMYNIDFTDFNSDNKVKDINLAMFVSQNNTPCHPVINTEIDLPSTTVKLFDITGLFNNGSLYYDINIDISQIKEIEASGLKYIPLTGLGLKPDKINNASPEDETFWVGWLDLYYKTFKYPDIGKDPFEEMNDKISSSDYIKWKDEGGPILQYIKNDELINTSITDYSNLQDNITHSNSILSNKKVNSNSISGRINLDFILPYVAGRLGNYEIDINIGLNFKSGQPNILANNIIDNSTPAETTLSTVLTGVWENNKKILDDTVSQIETIITDKDIVTYLYENKTSDFKLNFYGLADPVIGGAQGESILMAYSLKEADLIAADINEDTIRDSLISTGSGGLSYMWQTGDLENLSSITDTPAFVNYNLNLSKRRAYICAKYIVESLINDGWSIIAKDYTWQVTTNIYDIQIMYSFPDPPIEGIDYTDPDAYIQKLVNCYGFGSMFANAELTGNSIATSAQRLMGMKTRFPTKTLYTSFKIGDNIQLGGYIPIGQEELGISSGDGFTRIGNNTIYTPHYYSTDEKYKTYIDYSAGQSIENQWETILSYIGTPGDDFEQSKIKNYSNINNPGAKRRAMANIENFISKCFDKNEDNSYNKVFRSFGTWLDNIWLIIEKN